MSILLRPSFAVNVRLQWFYGSLRRQGSATPGVGPPPPQCVYGGRVVGPFWPIQASIENLNRVDLLEGVDHMRAAAVRIGMEIMQGERLSDGSLRSRSISVAAAFAIGFHLAHTDVANAAVIARPFLETLPWENSQVVEQPEPTRGSCATCIGVVDETLGACNAITNCVSSFDDRPRFFVAPWEFPGQLSAAVDELKRALLTMGASIDEQEERYIHAVFTDKDGVVDDVEFLFSIPAEDATVNMRSASRAGRVSDNERNKKRLEEIRRTLTWEQVPVLRNRNRTLFFLESPWDSFGPEPPPTYDYESGLEFVPD